jgi:hypothetical protein
VGRVFHDLNRNLNRKFCCPQSIIIKGSLFYIHCVYSGLNEPAHGHERCEKITRNKFFKKTKFCLTGLQSDKITDIEFWIKEAGGEVVNMDFNGITDYLVVGSR